MKRRVFGFIIASSVVVVCFQNCAKNAQVASQVTESQYITELRDSTDAEHLPELLASAQVVLHKLGEDIITDNSLWIGDRLSIVVVLNPAAESQYLTINSGALLDEVSIEYRDAKIVITRSTDAGNYSQIEIPYAESEPAVVAASFGIQPEEQVILINGVLQSSQIEKVGTPLEFNYIAKEIQSGALAEFLVYSSELAAVKLNVLSRHVARSHKFKNVRFDMAVLNPDQDAVVVENPLFTAAKAVIDTNCLSCHNSSAQGDFRNLRESDFIRIGFVTAGDPAASPLYFRLNGAVEGNGPRNMPAGQAALSASDVQAVYDWIQSIQ